ncbi:MAG: hypothetical protein JKY14_01940 [Paraglaciecola sp.]|nr:hypothetical protein [Paraglaciecola sp.]
MNAAVNHCRIIDLFHMQDVFADDVNITEFSTADAPTLGEVNAQASEQFNSQFNKLIELIK